MQLKTKDEIEAAGGGNFQSRDELYETAVDIVIRERRGSVSLLQRALGIGYGRAARLIDFMAEDAVVGQYNGAQARDVLISLDDWESRNQPAASTIAGAAVGDNVASTAGALGMKTRTLRTPNDGAPTVSAPQRRRNKIVPDPDEPSELEEESLDEEEAEYEDDYVEDAEAESEEEEDEELAEGEEDEWEEDGDDESDEDEPADEDDELEEDEEWDDEELEDDEEWKEAPVAKTKAPRSSVK
jgi:S-DNA-T family DNA segregation ATPase FtsK/SpoIIIE